MVDHDGPPDGAPPGERREVNYEPRDVNLKLIVASAVGLAIAVVVFALLLRGQFHLYTSRTEAARAGDDERDPLAAEESRQGIDERIGQVHKPKLEGLEPLESTAPSVYPGKPMSKYSPRYRPETWPAGNEQQLKEFAWVDKEKGIVRIPIDDAMRLMLERKVLKARSEPERKQP